MGGPMREWSSEMPHASAACDGLRTARLAFPRGAADVTLEPIVATPTYRVIEPLLQAWFSGRRPELVADGGDVYVEYSSFGWFDWRPSRSRTRLALNPDVAWEILVRGGVSKLRGDLRRVRVARVAIGVGASELTLSLPRPEGTVSVEIAGGASDVAIDRPAGVPLRLVVRGGASGLSVDTLRLGSIGRELRWQSSDWAAASDRYD